MIQKKKTRNAHKTWPTPKVANIAPPLVVEGTASLRTGDCHCEKNAIDRDAQPG
jgi:hypothetical protein